VQSSQARQASAVNEHWAAWSRRTDEDAVPT